MRVCWATHKVRKREKGNFVRGSDYEWPATTCSLGGSDGALGPVPSVLKRLFMAGRLHIIKTELMTAGTAVQRVPSGCMGRLFRAALYQSAGKDTYDTRGRPPDPAQNCHQMRFFFILPAPDLSAPQKSRRPMRFDGLPKIQIRGETAGPQFFPLV